MGIDLFIGTLIFFAAIICELIDGALGMLYGTILSPVLLLMGFDPALVVSSILFSQAIGGLSASIFHHRKGNANFSIQSEDFKVVLLVVSLGILASFSGAHLIANVSQATLKGYIGIMVVLMGLLILSGIKFLYSRNKVIILGLLSSFNKGFTGGGFGPLMTAGQVIISRNGKNAIGSTTLAEAPICLTGFLTILLTRGISDWRLPLILCGGALLGGVSGPHFTALFKSEAKLKKILGLLTVILGIWILLNTFILK